MRGHPASPPKLTTLQEPTGKNTGLATTIYKNFKKFPVVEDQDRDEESIIECQLRKNPRRLQPLLSANLIGYGRISFQPERTL